MRSVWHGHKMNIKIYTSNWCSYCVAAKNFFKENKNIKKPKAIIANTVKGKGFSFSENNNDWHHSVLSKSFHEKALKELMEK